MLERFTIFICGSKHNNLKNSNVLSEIKSMTADQVWVRFFFYWGHELVNVVSTILPWWQYPPFWVRMPSVPVRSRTSPELKMSMSRLDLVSSSFSVPVSSSNAVLCHFMSLLSGLLNSSNFIFQNWYLIAMSFFEIQILTSNL